MVRDDRRTQIIRNVFEHFGYDDGIEPVRFERQPLRVSLPRVDSFGAKPAHGTCIGIERRDRPAEVLQAAFDASSANAEVQRAAPRRMSLHQRDESTIPRGGSAESVVRGILKMRPDLVLFHTRLCALVVLVVTSPKETIGLTGWGQCTDFSIFP